MAAYADLSYDEMAHLGGRNTSVRMRGQVLASLSQLRSNSHNAVNLALTLAGFNPFADPIETLYRQSDRVRE